jgi:hypothetical protein
MASYSYAEVADYELRTNLDVPPAAEDTVQTRLDDASNLIALYLGECEPEVATAFPEILTALACSVVFRYNSVPAGVRSKSIGATSVSYSDDAANVTLLPAEENLLDDLMARACVDEGPDNVPGLGCVGASWGGWYDKSAHWARDVDVWVM